MEVVIIRVDDSYLPAVAKDYKKAIQYLVDERWIDEGTEIWDDGRDRYRTIKEAGIKIEDIKNWDRRTFERYFGHEYELLDREFVE